MNIFLQYFNALGVASLVALCVLQWSANSRLDQSIGRLERTREEQQSKLAEQEAARKQDATYLDHVQQQLSASMSAAGDLQGRLISLQAERDRLAKERDQLVAQHSQLAEERNQLKANLEKWNEAVTARDQLINQASDELRKSIADRDQAVTKYNDLVGKYNIVVKDFNAMQGKR